MTETPTTTHSHRLLVSAERWARLRALPDHPAIRFAAETLERLVEPWMADRAITVDETAHNYHLVRARYAQTRVVSLLVMYGRTGDRRYRETAMDYLRDIAGWEYWSWITWRQGNADPNAIFDLSYGENSMTLALAYDWLTDELSDEERAFLVDTARRRSLIPYLTRNTDGNCMWYMRMTNSNWNTVCNGGAGMLALVLGDACPESARVLEAAEDSVHPYFEFMEEDGAWPEGVGYWAYGHRYGYYFLLSYERATGQTHPMLERPGSSGTLRFPLVFSPNEVASGFGDANSYRNQPFHYAAAERYAMWDVVAELDRRLLRIAAEGTTVWSTDGPWPAAAEVLLFHPGHDCAAEPCTWPRTSIQRGLEWSYLADQWPEPRLYVSVRGGTTDAPHTHQDLTSVNVVVGKESLIINTGGEYIDTTFSPRRFELYEISAASKNGMFVNGVGLAHPGTATSSPLRGDGWEGVLLDVTAAMSTGTAAYVGGCVYAAGRAVLMLNGTAILVIDRVTLKHAGLMEARFHTYGELSCDEDTARIEGTKESLHLAFAANVPAGVMAGAGLPTSLRRKPDQIARWMTRGKHLDMVLVTLMTPNGTGQVSLDAESRTIHVAGPGFDVTLHYPAEGLGITE